LRNDTLIRYSSFTQIFIVTRHNIGLKCYIRYVAETLSLVMTSGLQCTYDVLQKHIIAITSAQKHDQRHRGRLYYRRINRMSRLSPQTERYTRIAALYFIFTHFLHISFGFADFREFFI
jgi:hypothetical protein